MTTATLVDIGIARRHRRIICNAHGAPVSISHTNPNLPTSFGCESFKGPKKQSTLRCIPHRPHAVKIGEKGGHAFAACVARVAIDTLLLMFSCGLPH